MRRLLTAKAPRTPRKARTKAVTAEAQRRGRNAGESYNRKGAKAQRKAAKNFLFESGFPLRPFAPSRLCGYSFPLRFFRASAVT
ncbi:MAG TPA: hypothetical protein VFM11_00350, partial [Burkholderiales bacterium]|nr:hypothetical protein [Burkholderiales bacterium]